MRSAIAEADTNSDTDPVADHRTYACSNSITHTSADSSSNTGTANTSTFVLAAGSDRRTNPIA